MNVIAGKPGNAWGGGSAIKYWAYRTDDGQIALSSAYDGVIGQIGRASDIAPERWIYPDGNDEALKREVAKIQASDNPLNIVDGEDSSRHCMGMITSRNAGMGRTGNDG